MTTAYKIFTHDLCSPFQGGNPVWNGSLPYRLPTVKLDTSDQECAEGWNACLDPDIVIRIAGLWPDGRPARLFEVQTDTTVVQQGDKIRAATWEVTRELDIVPAIRNFSEVFGDLAEEMAKEQTAWYRALGRPNHDPVAVEKGLQVALKTRGLDWQLHRFESSDLLWDTRTIWDAQSTQNAKAAWDAQSTQNAKAAWDAWVARYTKIDWGIWSTWDVKSVEIAWAAGDAKATKIAKIAWAAKAAWAAGTALTVWYAACRNWVTYDPQLFTKGLRQAYRDGLYQALRTGSGELGWVMDLEHSP